MTFRCLLADNDAGPGTMTLTPESRPNLAIPDNSVSGVSNLISVSSGVSIASIKVGVDITHSYRGDLRVTLTTPQGAEIELHPKGRGGSADDLKVIFDESSLPALATLRGMAVQGDWKLTVRDLAASDTGKLNRWWLEISTADAAQTAVELQESPGTAIPDYPSAGITRVLNAPAAGNVSSVEVSVNISHTYVGDLRVLLVSPAGTEVLLHDGAGGSADNLVRTWTAATAPSLAALTGQILSGTWRILVSDRAAQDVGKLNSWGLRIKSA